MENDSGGTIGDFVLPRLATTRPDLRREGLLERIAAEQWLTALQRHVRHHEVVEPLFPETLDVVAGQVIDRPRAIVEYTADAAVDHPTHGVLEAAVARFAEEGGTDAPLKLLIPQAVESLLRRRVDAIVLIVIEVIQAFMGAH